MKIPLEISVRNFELPDDVEDFIRDKAEKLDNFFEDIIRCRVMADIPHRSQRKGDLYNVRIEITLPGAEVIVRREPHEDLLVAIVNSFDVAERQLKDYARKQRGDVKYHEERPQARIDKLFPEEGYGFLMTPDGREIYFHENSVVDGKFDKLKAGMTVYFVETLGNKGPQASTVIA